MLTAISVAAILLILAPTLRRQSHPGSSDWLDPMWDVYDEIASGPAD